RRRECRSGDTRRGRKAARTPRSPAARAAARTAGCRVSPAGPRTSYGAELGEVRVAGELDAERRLGAVAGMDDRLRREAVGEHPHRVEERVPVGAGQVDPSDGAREEEVAAEQLALGEVRD